MTALLSHEQRLYDELLESLHNISDCLGCYAYPSESEMEIQGIGVAIATHEPPLTRHTLVGVQAILTPRPTNMGYVNTQGEIVVSCTVEFSGKGSWLPEIKMARTRFVQEMRGMDGIMFYLPKIFPQGDRVIAKVTVSQEVVL
jgi:hypothetical protein